MTDLLARWAKEQGFEAWAADHAAVLRNLEQWFARESVSFGPTDRTTLSHSIAEALAARGYLANPDDIERVARLVREMIDPAESRKENGR